MKVDIWMLRFSSFSVDLNPFLTRKKIFEGRLDGVVNVISVFFDRLHGGNEDNPFIETLNWDSPT